MKTVGERVRWAREQRGLTQAELDEIADLTCGHTGSIERGNRENPAAQTVTKLARALRITPQWLMFGGPRPQITAKAG
jgi:transcriptional regulator with XRE-family HTH domain